MSTDIRGLEASWQDDPANAEYFGELEQHFFDQADWKGLIALFEKGRPHLADADEEFGPRLVGQLRQLESKIDENEERAHFLVALGDACRDYLDNRDEAMTAYQRSFKTFPQDTTCLDRAREIYRKLGDFERILTLYKLELKVKKAPEPRAAVLVRMAQVNGDDLRRTDTALELLEEAASLDETNEVAIELYELYSEGQTIYGLIQDLVRDAREAAGSDTDEAASLMWQAAALEQDREAGSLEHALQIVYEGLEIAPDDEPLLTTRANLRASLGIAEEPELDEDSDASETMVMHGGVATQILPAITVEQMMVHDRSEVVEDSLAEDSEAEDDESPAAGELSETDEDVEEESEVTAEDEHVTDEEAEEAAEEAEEAEDEAAEEEAAEEEAEEAEEAEEEAEEAEEEAEEAEEAEEEAEEEEEEEEAEEEEAADTSLLGQLTENPTDIAVLLAFGEECRETGDFDLLKSTFEKSIKRLRKKDGELEAMLFLANTLWHDVEDFENAEYYFKRIKLLDATHADMLAFYEAFFERNGAWKKLFNLLNSAQQHAEDPDTKFELTSRLAELAEHKMENPDKAIDVWKAFVRQAGPRDTARDELRRLYEQNQKWSMLVDIYKEDLSVLGEDAPAADRLEIMERMATLYQDELKLEPMVIATLQNILEIDPDNTSAFERLRELLDRSKRYNDLATILDQKATSVYEAGDIAGAVALLSDVAEIWHDRLRNVTQALPFLERIVAIDPENAETIERLKAIYEQRRDFGSLFDLMRRESESLEGEERLEQLHKILKLANEKVRDPELIAPILEDILELDSDNLEVLEQLETLRRRSAEPEDLARALESKARIIDGEDAAAALVEAGEIRLQQLDDFETAKTLWMRALDAHPGDANAFNALSSAYVARREFDELEALYREGGSFDSLFELLDSAAATTDDTPIKTTLYGRMAKIAEEDLNDPDRVIISLESLRECTASPTEVSRELIHWYAQVGETDREIEILQYILEASDDDHERFETVTRLRDLEVERGDTHAALSWSVQAIRIDPSSEEALDESRKLAQEAELLLVWVERLDDVSRDLEDETHQETLWAAAGAVLANDLDNPEGALPFYERLRERHPSDLEILGQLESLYDRAGQGEARIEVLRAQTDVLTERGATKADLVDELSKIADVQRTQLGQRDAARDTYAEILDIDPEHLPSLRGTKELYREENQWDDVIECLLREEALSATESPERRLGVWMELGDMYRLHKDDLSESLRYYGMVLADEPEHEGAVTALETLLAEPEFAREAALLIEPIFRESGAGEQLIVALEARREATDDRFEEAEILDELIPIYIELENIETAFDRACRQFELDAERSEIWLRLEQLGAKLNRWSDLEAIFSRFAPEDSSASATRFDLLRHLAAIREYQLNMKEEALQAWERLYEHDPLDLAHVDALERLYRQLGKHRKLVDILSVKAEITQEPDERVELLRNAAQVADDVLADTDATVDILYRLLELENDDQLAVQGLRKHLRDTERWFDLSDLLVQQSEMASDIELRRSLLLELVDLRLNQLDDAPGAVDVVKQVFSENTQSDLALSAVEDVDTWLEEHEGDLELRLELARIVEPTYRSQANFGRLVHVLSVKLEAAEPYEELAILDELSDLLATNLDDTDAAFEATRQAVLLNADDTDRRLRLETLGDMSERFEDVIETLARAGEDADPTIAVEIFRRVGFLLDERAGRHDEAIVAYERALEENDADEDTLRALESLFERTQRYEELADNLRHQVIHGDPDRRGEVLRRVGVIEEEVLGRNDAAIDAYVEIVDAEPDAVDALEALERLYTHEERWADLADALNRRSEVSYNPSDQLQAFSRLAAVRENELNDVVGAIEVHQRMLTVEPSHAEALNALDRLFRAEGDWGELADVLRSKLDNAAGADSDTVNGLEIDLATVLRTQLYDVEESLVLYRNVLARSPGHADAITALEELSDDETWLKLISDDLQNHYTDTENWSKLADLLERLAESESDPLERSRYHLQVAYVQRDGLENADEAVEAFSAAWKLDPENTDIRDELIALAAQIEAWKRLSEIYSDILLEAQIPEQMLDLHMRLAQLHQNQLEDESEAEIHYREAIDADDTCVDAFVSLEGILTRQERWHDLIEILERRFNVQIAQGDADAISLLHRAAQVQDEILDDGFTAVETYVRILEFDPADQVANSAVSRLYRTQERWEDLVAHLQQVLSMASDPTVMITLNSELAEIYASHLGNHAAAIEIYTTLLGAEPDHPPTIDALETLLSDAPEEFVPDIARLLENVYRARQDWEQLIHVLESLADVESEPVQKSNLLREVALIQDEQLNAPSSALNTLARVVAIEPSDISVRENIQHLAARTRAWKHLADIYDEVLIDNLDMGEITRSELLFERSRIFEERLEDLHEAQRLLEEVLLLQPESEPALDALERIYSRLEDWQSLGELYRRRADQATDPREARDWRDILASIYEDVVEDSAAAIDVYQEILAADPEDQTARRSLERLLSQSGRWYDLSDLYRQQSELARNADEILDARYKLAQVLESELDQIDEALVLYRDILAAEPHHFESRRALEGLARDLALREGAWPEHRLQIVELLLSTYDQQTQKERVVSLLEQKIELVEDIDQRVETHLRLADVLGASTRSEERSQALTHLASAFQIDPTASMDVRGRIEELAAELAAWERLVPIYLGGLEATDDVEAQVALLEATAEVLTDHLKDRDSAISAFQQVLDIDPTNENALHRLEKLYGELELWNPLVGVLNQRADASYDQDLQKRIFERIATIQVDVLGHVGEGITTYEKLREIEPARIDYADKLEILYEEAGQYEALEELLQAKLGITDEFKTRKGIFLKLARVQDDILNWSDAAIDSYSSVLELDPDHVESVNALVRLYSATERYPELLDALSLKADFAADVDSLNANLLQSGQVLMHHLNSPFDAMENFKTILARTPQHQEARSALSELLGRDDTQNEAASILRQLYRATDEWRELDGLIELQLEHTHDVDRRLELFEELATLQKLELNTPQMAFMTYGRALREMPSAAVLRNQLESLSQDLNNPDELIAVYEDALDSAGGDTEAELSLHKRLGTLYSEIDEHDEAIVHFEACLAIDEFDGETLDNLDQLYQITRRWEPLREILEKELAIADPSRMNDVRFRLGYLHEVIFENIEDALSQYRQIIAEEATHGGALEALERLIEDMAVRREICELLEPVYLQHDAWERLARLLNLKLDTTDEPYERAELLERIATIETDHFERPAVGYAYLGRSLREEPMNEDVQRRLEAIAVELGMHEELVALYEELIEDLTDPVRVVDLALVAGSVSVNPLADFDRAVRLYNRVLELDAENKTALDALEIVARHESDSLALARVLERKAEVLFDPDEKREALIELGHVRATREEFEEAIDAYHQALAIDEGDEEVMRALVDLLEITERYDDLVEILQRLVNYVDEPNDRFQLYVRIGQYSRVLLKDNDRAIDAYRHALNHSPDDPGVLEALDELFTETEEWPELAQILQQRLTQESDEARRLKLLVRTANLSYEKFNDVNGAIQTFNEAMNIAPTDEYVINSLDALYRGEEQWVELYQLYHDMTQTTSDPAALSNLHVRMADVSAHHLDDRDRAISHLNIVLEASPQHVGALSVLADLYEADEQWDALLQILERQVAGATTAEERADAYYRRAVVERDKLQDMSAAATDFVHVIESVPLHEPGLPELKQLYRDLSANIQLYGMLDFEASYRESEDDKIALYREMAELAHNALNDPAKRIEALEKAHALRADMSIVEPLLDAYILGGETDKAEPILESIIESLKADRKMKDVVRFQHLQGKLAEQKGDLDGAYAAYDAAHKVDASYIPNLLSLGKLLYHRQSWDDALKIFQTLLLHQMNINDDRDKVDVYYYLGMVRWQQGDPRRAKDMFNRALNINSAHQPSRDAIAQL